MRKKRMSALLGLVLCAALLAVPAAGAEAEAEPAPPVSQAPLGPTLLDGTVKRMDNGALLVTEEDGDQVVVRYDEKTYVVDGTTGAAADMTGLKDGESVRMYVGPVMALSYPPQTGATVILRNLPKDAPAPTYQQVAAVDTVNESGIALTTREGKQMTVPFDAKTSPYLTKNIVTYRDLIPGTWFLAWSSGAEVTRAVLFPYDTLPFTDVEKSHWAYNDILAVTSRGLLRCDSTLAFRPGDALTRAELVKALYQLAGSPVVIQSIPGFEDVQDGGDYLNALTWAVGNKLVNGYSDNTFRPNEIVSRQQLAVFLYRWEQHRGGGFQGAWMFLLDYPDRDSISEYAYEGVAWCVTNNVLSGRSDGTLAPNASVTRAAASAMLQRYLTYQANARSSG